MLFTVSKIIYQSGKSYLLFIFLATFLSLFSYILSSNIISSVDNYLKEQTRPLLWWDIVFRGEDAFDREYFDQTYGDSLKLAKTIETETTLFNSQQRPYLTELIYHDDSYPVYDSFSYDIINESGDLIVDPVLLEEFGESIDILGKSYDVKWVITGSPLWDFSAFSVTSNIYLPIENYDESFNPDSLRVDIRHYAWFYAEYDSQIVWAIKRDSVFDNFRISSLEDRNENIGEITDRLWLFINFFNLIVFVLTFFIIILSLETFYKKLKKTLWILTILGLSKGKMFLYNFIFIAFIFFVALLFSIGLNYVALIALWGIYDFLIFYPSSILQWVMITGVLLIIGVYSPFYKIYTSRIRDMLSDSSFFSNFWFVNYFIYLSLLFIGFYGISIISNISALYSFLYSIWFTLMIILLYILSSILLRALYFISKNVLKRLSFYSFDAVRSTIKPGNVSFFIVFSSFISFISIFVFFVFSGSFLNFITNFTESSNDTFIVDVPPSDIEIAREYFSSDEIYTIIPMRIVAVNGQNLDEFRTENGFRPRQFSREYLSTTRNLESDIISWKSISTGGVSLDKEFADEIGLGIWDTMLFSIAGIEKSLEVQNIRKAERSGASPFFYFSVDDTEFENFPKRYFISYKSENKPENTQFEYSQAVWWNVTFINAKEIIDIILDVAQKVLLIVYSSLSYVTLFAFLTFLVSIGFLRSFKDAKLRLMHILWWQKKSLERAVAGEYMYLMFFWLSIAVIIGTAWLWVLEYYVEFFTLDMSSYIQWLWVILWVLWIMSVFLLSYKKTID